jgi:hypothetical protein
MEGLDGCWPAASMEINVAVRLQNFQPTRVKLRTIA